MTLATVKLWDTQIGKVHWDGARRLGSFQFDPDFFAHGWDVSPLKMPLGTTRSYAFPELAERTFRRLPGLLADSLPDQFGDEVLAAWLISQNRQMSSMNPVERLCYTGKRGMGALEFEPTLDASANTLNASAPVDVDRLSQLAADVLSKKKSFAATLDANPLMPLLQVSTSPGGGLPKAVIAWNEQTNEVRSGQVDAGAGFTYWILKFGNLNRNGHPQAKNNGASRCEYAYHLMAKAANIRMTRCRLFEENGRAHFMTERFDRVDGEKRHVQTLCAMAHMDFHDTSANRYEDSFQVLRALHFSNPQKEELFRRMAFNVLANNYDDHTKNMGFIMDKKGRWDLAPAYDLTYAYDPMLSWDNAHMMSIGGKTDGFTQDDLLQVAEGGDLKIPRAKAILAEVAEAIAKWPEFAEQAGVTEDRMAAMRKTFPKIVGEK